MNVGFSLKKMLIEFDSVDLEKIDNYTFSELYLFDKIKSRMISGREYWTLPEELACKYDFKPKKNRTCFICGKNGSFGYDRNSLFYCSKHKLSGMENLYRKKCLKCDKTPSFGYPGTNTRLYCFDHRENNTLNFNVKRCLDCKNIANYGDPGAKIKLYCYDHRKTEMIYLHYQKCLDCDKIGTFCFEHEKKRLYCYDHKKQGMTSINTV